MSEAKPSDQWWPFECPELGSSFFKKKKEKKKSNFSLVELPVSQTLQEETAAFLLLDFLSESSGCSLHVSQPPTVCTCWSRYEGVFSFFSLTWTIISLFVVYALVWCLYIVGENPKSCKWEKKSCQILKKNSSSDFVLFLAFKCILDLCLFLFKVAYLYIRVDFSQASAI